MNRTPVKDLRGHGLCLMKDFHQMIENMKQRSDSQGIFLHLLNFKHNIIKFRGMPNNRNI